MHIVDETQLPVQRGATAHLVAWYERRTGRIVDVGIYSETTPTCPNLRELRSECLLSSMSRIDSNGGGFERAHRLLRQAIAKCPELHWVYGMRSYALGEVRRREMDALRGMQLSARAA